MLLSGPLAARTSSALGISLSGALAAHRGAAADFDREFMMELLGARFAGVSPGLKGPADIDVSALSTLTGVLSPQMASQRATMKAVPNASCRRLTLMAVYAQHWQTGEERQFASELVARWTACL
jgi:hypothetical protein